MNRRQWMALSAGTFAAGRGVAVAQSAHQGAQAANAGQGAALPLERYEPKSMLHVPETHVPRSRFPVIDFHTHITFAAGGGNPAAIRFTMDPANCLAVMDRKNIRTMVYVTGGYGAGLRDAIGKLQTAHPGRVLSSSPNRPGPGPPMPGIPSSRPTRSRTHTRPVRKG